MKIVIDENVAFAREYFGGLGELVLLPGRDMTHADVAEADALIVRSVTQVSAALLADSRVRFVGSCTIGMDHVETAWLEANGIAWACAPGCNANAVVQYVMAALQHLSVPMDGSCRVGVVGCGNVGSRLLRVLQAASIPCCGYDPFLADTDLPLVSFREVLACDVICLHTPLTRSGPHPTFHLFGQAVIDQLAAGTVLLNAGRGAVVDNRALLSRLQQKQDVRVALDVWENEPAISAALLDAVEIGTPHIAGYSVEGKWRGTVQVYESLCRFLGRQADKIDVVLPGKAGNYDISADDRALRTVYASEGAAGFDRLRKQYPARRESTLAKGVCDTSGD